MLFPWQSCHKAFHVGSMPAGARLGCRWLAALGELVCPAFLSFAGIHPLEIRESEERGGKGQSRGTFLEFDIH